MRMQSADINGHSRILATRERSDWIIVWTPFRMPVKST